MLKVKAIQRKADDTGMMSIEEAHLILDAVKAGFDVPDYQIRLALWMTGDLLDR